MTKKIKTIPIEHKILTIIDNFYCEVPEIELTKHLSIRCIDSLSDEEKAVFAGEEDVSGHISFNAPDKNNRFSSFTYIAYRTATGELLKRTRERGNYVFYWYFKGRVQEPLKQHYDFLLYPSDEIGMALQALRLLKDSIVGLYPKEHFFIEYPLLTKDFPRSVQRDLDGYQLSDPHEVDPFVLLPEEIDPLKDLVRFIKESKQPGVLTALSQLDKQYSRAYIADRLIDAVIALEALYAGQMNTEIKLRVGLRVSAHLGGSDPDLRERFFNLFKLAYDLRSGLVHGSIHSTRDIEKQTKKDWEDSEAFLSEINKMLRQSLHDILLNAKNRKLQEVLHEPLDKVVRRGEPFSWK